MIVFKKHVARNVALIYMQYMSGTIFFNFFK